MEEEEEEEEEGGEGKGVEYERGGKEGRQWGKGIEGGREGGMEGGEAGRDEGLALMMLRGIIIIILRYQSSGTSYTVCPA